jgi:hypothetical protein
VLLLLVPHGSDRGWLQQRLLDVHCMRLRRQLPLLLLLLLLGWYA